jgi:hypothetical protein
MNKFISSFEDFRKNSVYESDGFGTSDFLMRKISDVYHYFFTLDDSDGENPMGYHLIVGKYSEDEVIEGAKNSYCVLNINQIAPEVIEDIAIDKESIPTPNEVEFRSDADELSRIMEYTFKCVNDYLTYNPKIIRIYDEIQKNLRYKGKGGYTEYMKSIALSNLGSRWSVQQGVDSKSIIISR